MDQGNGVSPAETRVLRSLFNHIALPSCLPQKQELNIDEIEQALVKRLLDAVRVMRDEQGGRYHRVWDSLRRTLESYKSLHANGHLERSQLISYLGKLKTSDLVVLHVAKQNAGVFIYKPAE